MGKYLLGFVVGMVSSHFDFPILILPIGIGALAYLVIWGLED